MAYAMVAAATLGMSFARNLRSTFGLPRPPSTSRARAWAAAVRAQGFHIVEGFASREQCAAYRAEIDRVLDDHRAFVQERSDRRVFGIENASPVIAGFARDAELESIAEAQWRERGRTMLTLGARLEVTPHGRGSGEGWHRDSLFRQFKAILYVSDVGPENGPFQLVRGSQMLRRLFPDGVTAKLGYAQTRIDDDQVEALVARDPSRLATITGGAGTLLLVDTSAIHRGKPIESGTRYALTNYYMPTRTITPRRLDHFRPYVPPPAAP